MPEHPEKRKPGRTLPTTPEEFGNPRLNEPSRLLILELLRLVEGRYTTVTAMIKDAMESSDRPSWAVGSPDVPGHVRQAKSTVSKFLGGSAVRCPDWPTVVWIVRACAPEQATQLTAVMAGRWCAATGEKRPPGYTGAIQQGESVYPELSDPDLAPDDTTRARLLEDKVRTLEAELRGRDDVIADNTAKIAQLTRLLATNERRQLASSDATMRDLTFRTAELDGVRAQLHRSQEDNRHLWRCLRRAAHYLAITSAHLATRRPPTHPDSLFPIPFLKADRRLAELLTPVWDRDRHPRIGWRAAYLNTLLRICGHPHDGRILMSLYQTKAAAQLNDVLVGRRAPSPALTDEIVKLFPMAADVLREIRRADETPTVPIVPRLPGPAPAPAIAPRPYVTVQELLEREVPSATTKADDAAGNNPYGDSTRKRRRRRQPD